MAEKLDSFPFTSRGGYGSKYEQYLDGGIYRLVVGEDIPSLGSRTYLHTLAKRRGLRVRMHDEGTALVVQAYSQDERPLKVA